MSNIDLYAATNVRNRYVSHVLPYVFNEDILKLAVRSPSDVTLTEYLMLQAACEAVDNLEQIFGDDYQGITNFLITANDNAPFYGISPVSYVRAQPTRILSTSFYIMCWRTGLGNQLALEDLI